MFVVAVDVGYSNLKILAGKPGNSPTTTILPAGAGPLSTMPNRLGRPGGDQHLVVSVDGESWAAGVEPSRLQNWERELHPDYSATIAYRALFHAALAVAGHGRIDRLVTGLPVAHYQDAAKREQLRSRLLGTHQITPKRQVSVEEVDILPQPTGAYLDLIKSTNAAKDFEEARLLVIDPGFFSVDWVLIEGGELRSTNSGSSTSAMSLLLETADDLIQKDHGGQLSRDQLEKAVRLGRNNVPLFGSPIELAPYIAAAAKHTAATAMTAVRQSLRGERREPDILLLTGGGAAVYAEATREAFPKARVIVPDTPVLANVRGFWRYAEDATESAAPEDRETGEAVLEMVSEATPPRPVKQPGARKPTPTPASHARMTGKRGTK